MFLLPGCVRQADLRLPALADHGRTHQLLGSSGAAFTPVPSILKDCRLMLTWKIVTLYIMSRCCDENVIHSMRVVSLHCAQPLIWEFFLNSESKRTVQDWPGRRGVESWIDTCARIGGLRRSSCCIVVRPCCILSCFPETRTHVSLWLPTNPFWCPPIYHKSDANQINQLLFIS